MIPNFICNGGEKVNGFHHLKLFKTLSFHLVVLQLFYLMRFEIQRLNHCYWTNVSILTSVYSRHATSLSKHSMPSHFLHNGVLHISDIHSHRTTPPWSPQFHHYFKDYTDVLILLLPYLCHKTDTSLCRSAFWDFSALRWWSNDAVLQMTHLTLKWCCAAWTTLQKSNWSPHAPVFCCRRRIITSFTFFSFKTGFPFWLF